MKRITYFFVGFVLAVGLSGCTSVVKGVPVGDGAIYKQGTLRAVLGAQLPTVDQATRATMEELDFVAIDAVTDRLKSTVKATMADGTKVKVKLEAEDFESTSIRIKVGNFGDDSISIQILKHIKRRL